MGRKLMRVPMDFSWPLGKVWGGYVNPYSSMSVACPDCNGSGYSKQAKRFSDEWYGEAHFDPVSYGANPLTVDHPAVVYAARRNVERSPEYYGSGERAVRNEARRLFNHWRGQWCHHLIQADVDALIADDRLWVFTRSPRDAAQAFVVAMKIVAGGNSWLPESNGYTPTAAEVNAWSLTGMGHDATNQWTCIRARCEREGVPVECQNPACSDGSVWPNAEVRAAYEAWVDIEPPAGPGFQLWETTSEGSPVSPVFATIEDLCLWCADNATTFGSEKASADRWRSMLDDGFVAHIEERVDGGTIVFM